MQHDELDILLNRRTAPKTPGGLAERIIYAAISQIQENPRVLTFWNELYAMLALPHPSVAVVTGILLGLVVGMQAGDGLFVLQQDWSSFLYVNEGGWL